MLQGATSAIVLIASPFGSGAHANVTAPLQPTARAFVGVPRPIAPASFPRSGVEWLDRDIRKIARLPRDWDGFGADRVPATQLARIARIVKGQFADGLPQGTLVPGADGSLQLEWHFVGSSYGLLVDHDGSLFAWHQSKDTGQIVDAENASALALLEASVLQSLA